MRNEEMQRAPFKTRSTGVLFWGGGYLLAAIAWGIALAALWPQGSACSTSCGARLEAGAVAIVLLAGGGLVGLALAIWLGVTRRPVAPRRLLAVLVGVLVASLVTAALLVHSAPADSDAAGLATVRSAWSWAVAVPTSALLATAAVAFLRGRVRGVLARPASARARRA
jgi:hypothetical protein